MPGIQRENYYYTEESDVHETVVYKDSSGTVVDLTGMTVTMKLFDPSDRTEKLELTTSGGITVATPSNGQIEFKITAAQLTTANLSPMTFVLYVDSGDAKKAILTGSIIDSFIQG